MYYLVSFTVLYALCIQRDGAQQAYVHSVSSSPKWGEGVTKSALDELDKPSIER